MKKIAGSFYLDYQGIHFTLNRYYPINLNNISCFGWYIYKSKKLSINLLLITKKNILFIFKKPKDELIYRKYKFPQQTVSNLEEFAKTLSDATNKKILTANENWFKEEWIKYNNSKLELESKD